MPAKPSCRVPPFISWLSNVSTTLFKPRNPLPAVNVSPRTATQRAALKSCRASALYRSGSNSHAFAKSLPFTFRSSASSSQQQANVSLQEVRRFRSLFENNLRWSKRQTLYERLIFPRALSTKTTLKQNHNDLVPGIRASFLDVDDSTDPSITLQKSLAAVPHHAIKDEIRLRRTEIDIKGNIVRSDVGEFLKSELCLQFGLHPRDLRKIDGGFSNQVPVILVRPEVIIVNMGHIRALIKADRIVLFDSPDSTDRVEDSPFVKYLQERLRMSMVQAGGQTFEFRALEAIFISTVGSLHSDMEILVKVVTRLLGHIEEEVDQFKLKEMLQYTKKISRFESKALLIREVFEELLEQDEDLAAMYLTEKKQGHPRAIDKHDEAEILLESYMKQVEEIVNVVTIVKHQVQSTEDYVNAILGAKRNQLLMFELRIALGTLGISSGALIAGLYGMNLQNYLEHDPHAFAIVSAFAVSLGATLFGTCVRKLRVLAVGAA